MKVYICIKENFYDLGGLLITDRVGKLFCEDGDHYKNSGYPVDASFIENDHECYKFLFNDTKHNADYYIDKKYTQYEVDELLIT